jgi:hypothetical protein
MRGRATEQMGRHVPLGGRITIGTRLSAEQWTRNGGIIYITNNNAPGGSTREPDGKLDSYEVQLRGKGWRGIV